MINRSSLDGRLFVLLLGVVILFTGISLPDITSADSPSQSIKCLGDFVDPNGSNPYSHKGKGVGQCTWWAWSQRTDLPWFHGDAGGDKGDAGDAANWANSAFACGFPVNSTVAPGDIAVFPYGHVAYVKSVNPDGSYNISEYNYPLPQNSLRRNDRTVVPRPNDGVQFIHEKTPEVSHSQPDFSSQPESEGSAKTKPGILDQFVQSIQQFLGGSPQPSPQPPIMAGPGEQPQVPSTNRVVGVTITPQSPDQFNLVSPFGNQSFRDGALPNLQWKATTDPDGDPVRYKVIIDNANSPDARLPGERNHIESDWMTVTNWQPSNQGLEIGGRYTWYVSADDYRGLHTESIDRGSFVIVPLCTGPTCPCPAGIGPGPTVYKAGNYEPTKLTQQERQWLWDKFEPPGIAPVGYGGKVCGQKPLTATADPSSGTMDTPFRIVVSGFKVGESVKVTTIAKDCQGYGRREIVFTWSGDPYVVSQDLMPGTTVIGDSCPIVGGHAAATFVVKDTQVTWTFTGSESGAVSVSYLVRGALCFAGCK